ncbi:purple acid phosphatase family protein [Aquiflexum lacus]|uniref:purple acid phosphatase family protein n=1 Tax=Aquiflexum lacus TaxID=2483805 RepID=UPI00189309BE|nr:metallophosphoesterase family protein [Aquiflexum lacus]
MKLSRSASLALFLLFSFYLTSCNSKEEKQETLNKQEELGPRHLRVIWTEDPSTYAIISWTTMLEHGKKHTVYYDTVSREGVKLDYSFQVLASKNGAISMVEEDFKEGVSQGYYHHADLKNLKPSTTYYFVVETDDLVSDEFYFISGPEDDRAFSLLWGGDSRLGGPDPRYAGRTPHVDRQAMNRRIKALMDEDPNILGFIHGADYGTTADWRHLYWWFEDHELVIGEGNRLLPLIISRGNHDMQIGFEENFWLGDTQRKRGFDYYFSTQLGSETAILTLNTEISVAGDQRDWLEENLPKKREENRWLLVNYHRPAYPVVKDFENATFKRVRDTWVPYFEKYNIDLALESDGHILKRTVPIRNNKYDETGIIYIGEGGLGVPQRVADSTRWFIQPPGFAMSAHNVHKLTFSEDKISIKAFGMEGEILDQFEVKPRK